MNRDELYRQVWSNPMTHVAREIGKSDVAVAKLCKKLEVPVPPRGYWAKLQAGKQVAQTPLPPTPSESGPSSLVEPSSQEKAAAIPRKLPDPVAVQAPAPGPSAKARTVSVEMDCGGISIRITVSG